MDEKTIQQYTKELTLNYLEEIGAIVEETNEIYSVTIPQEYLTLFGGSTKRITFDQEIASTHSCELVVPSSRFLSIIMEEVRKQAPVVAGSITHDDVDPAQFLNKLKLHNCTVNIQNINDVKKFGVRFYFNVILKSTKGISQLRWIDISLDMLEKLDFPSFIKLEQVDFTNLETPGQKVDHAYAEAIKIMQGEIEPMARKYVELTRDKIDNEANLVRQVCNKRMAEIKEDLNHIKLQLKDYDKKIRNAKYNHTMVKHAEQREKISKKLEIEEKKVVEKTIELTRERDDKITQIGTRYKPTIEFALIAAQIYLYNTLNCVLHISNGKISKQVEAKFITPTLSYIIKCELCENVTESLHLCTNSHVACDFCAIHCINCEGDFCLKCKDELVPCYICKEGLCVRCSDKCKFCSEFTCQKHSMKCMHCSELMCFFCQKRCGICAKIFCNPSLKKCSSCNKETCIGHTSYCFHCQRAFCSQHTQTCPICNNVFCEFSQTECKICNQKFSTNCVSKNTCLTCSNLTEVNTENDAIKELVAKYPEYLKSKKWEVSSNNRFHIFRIKKLLGSRIIVFDRKTNSIVMEKKGGIF